jgi:zinc transport system permease protein
MTAHLGALPLPLPYPFDLAFMQRALAAGLVVGAFAPLIGTFLVQKRMSLIGDGIGHLAFAGVALGAVAGVYPLWTALAVATGGALGVERLRARRRASGDLALALFFYSGIALGIVLLSRELNPTTVVVLLGAAVAVAILSVRRALFAVVADEEWARVAGLPVTALNNLLAVTTAVAVVASMRVVGILLVAGLMVLPVASAQLLARSFRGTMALAMAIGIGSVLVGLTASRLWGLASGGMIVLVAAATFAVVAVVTGTKSRARASMTLHEETAGGSTRGGSRFLSDSHSD